MKINTRQEAETYINNSGIIDWEFEEDEANLIVYIYRVCDSNWEFEGEANLNDLISYIYRECDSNIDIEDQFNDLLCDYLEETNENISNYSLKRSS